MKAKTHVRRTHTELSKGNVTRTKQKREENMKKTKTHTYEKDCHGKFPTKNTQSRNTLS
jgi:hypothetical protein